MTTATIATSPVKSVAQKFSLAGRVALVTGASSGFGAHFAGVLAQAGAQVACVARRGGPRGAGARTNPGGRRQTTQS